jgi:hypothetical protein
MPFYILNISKDHLASQGLSNLGIATCMPKINSAKQRMWRMDILLVLFGVSFSDVKDGISIGSGVMSVAKIFDIFNNQKLSGGLVI